MFGSSDTRASQHEAAARARDGEAGASLIEVMIAMVVATVVLGGLISTVLGHGKLRRTHIERNAAIAAAIDMLEDVRAVPFADVPMLDGQGFDVADANGNAGGLRPQAGDADGLPGELRVTTDQSAGGTTLYRVQATVRWAGMNGNTAVSLGMLLGDRK